MTITHDFVALNRASTEHIRAVAGQLSETELQTPVGEHWTTAIVLAHLAWWDRRVLYVLDMTEKDGKLFVPEIDIFVNDLSLPLWAAVPPSAARSIALETFATLDARLEAYPRPLLEAVYAYNPRWVVRAMHRGEHWGEAEAALQAKGVWSGTGSAT